MSTLLERMKAKKAAAAAKAAQPAVEAGVPVEEVITLEMPWSESRVLPARKTEEVEEVATLEYEAKIIPVIPVVEVEEVAMPLPTPAPTAEPNDILMGITVEDMKARIAHVFEHAKSAEKHEIEDDMNGLKKAIMANPSIVQHLLPEDIGMMVGTLRKIHSEARAEAKNTPAVKRKKKSDEAKEAKEMLKQPMNKEDLDSLMDEL